MYTWVDFISEKSNMFDVFEALYHRLRREKGDTIRKVVQIRNDHGREFNNSSFSAFCNSKGSSYEFSASITPQQNGIMWRNNRTLQEMTRVMIFAKDLPLHFQAEALKTTCHVHNRVTIRMGTTITYYEI